MKFKEGRKGKCYVMHSSLTLKLSAVNAAFCVHSEDIFKERIPVLGFTEVDTEVQGCQEATVLDQVLGS